MSITKNFRLNIIFRLCIIILAIGVLFYLILLKEQYLRSGYLAILVVILIAEMIWYIERINRDFNAFLLGLLQADFTATFNEKQRGSSFTHLYATFNKINRKFKQISAEKEIQHLYLETLVEHVQTGIMSFAPNGKIHLMNDTLKLLLNKPHLMHIDGLKSVDPALATLVTNIAPGENKLHKITVNNNLLQLAVHATAFKLNNAEYKLITIQDIKNELDSNELDAWQKLIRVLTHEIMNSVTPIISLTATLYGMVKDQENTNKPLDQATMSNLLEGLDVIMNRSNGLQHFTESYRSLSQIPQPDFKPTKIVDLIERVITLFKSQYPGLNLTTTYQEKNLTLEIDPELIEQVIINIVKNAIESTTQIEQPYISINIQAINSTCKIDIKDNGTGISEEVLEKIFIPFYTTKNEGSGIGLALSKQILHLHGGKLSALSSLNKGCVFTITL